MNGQIQFKTLSQTREDKRRAIPNKLENTVTSNNSRYIDKFLPVNGIEMY